CMQGLKFPWTF
nr:immunoglobulin light chain junction region [Macaca mulatta]